MGKYVGIWIDHEKAILATLAGDDQTVTRIESGVEKHVRLAGGSRSSTPYGPQDVASEDRIERRRAHQLRRYYQRVIDGVGDAERILVFGPGEAKVEFRKELEKSKELGRKLAAVETADKMTDRQVGAKVRGFFLQRR